MKSGVNNGVNSSVIFFV